MEWLVWITLLGIWVTLVLMNRRLTKIEEKQKVILAHLVNMTQSRQARITHRHTTQAIPSVDSKVRTTYRDSDDLPIGGRIATGLHRRRKDFARENNDD